MALNFLPVSTRPRRLLRLSLTAALWRRTLAAQNRCLWGGPPAGGGHSEAGASRPVRRALARLQHRAAWPQSGPQPQPGPAKLEKVNMRNTTGIMINRNKKGQNQKGFVKRKTAGNKAENSSAPRQFRLQNTNH